jgi:multimeric flavodoxin WrbA
MMDYPCETIRRCVLSTTAGEYSIELVREDLSEVYPGMARFTLCLRCGEHVGGIFRTNTYEYSPTDPLDADGAARKRMDEWVQRITINPTEFAAESGVSDRPGTKKTVDAVILQGSPRADGNCAILAEWAAKAVRDIDRTARVYFVHDLEIKACIACYQCYNTGRCIYRDDMGDLIDTISSAEMLIVCSPVYTNTVPAGLKLVMDRFQAHHAAHTLGFAGSNPKGILLAVAGRRGFGNFRCLTSVVHAFMRNAGISPSEDILTDGMDEARDVRTIPGLEDRVRSAVLSCFQPKNSTNNAPGGRFDPDTL